jgi:hypothetical protein
MVRFLDELAAATISTLDTTPRGPIVPGIITAEKRSKALGRELACRECDTGVLKGSGT